MNRAPSGTKERVRSAAIFLSPLLPSRRPKAPLRRDGGRGSGSFHPQPTVETVDYCRSSLTGFFRLLFARSVSIPVDERLGLSHQSVRDDPILPTGPEVTAFDLRQCGYLEL